MKLTELKQRCLVPTFKVKDTEKFWHMLYFIKSSQKRVNIQKKYDDRDFNTSTKEERKQISKQ
jgi:hypothetical protein